MGHVRVHLDTSLLVHATSSIERRRRLDAAAERGDRLFLSTITLYEWLRGPRTATELTFVDALFPESEQIVFGLDAARAAARVHRAGDIAIAGCAIVHEAALWTLNPDDFRDIPGLML